MFDQQQREYTLVCHFKLPASEENSGIRNQLSTNFAQCLLNLERFNQQKHDRSEIDVPTLQQNALAELHTVRKYFMDNWEIIGNGKLQDNVMTKPTGYDGWVTMFIFNQILNSGVWEFKLLVQNIHTDKSGLVFGFFQGDNRDPSPKNIISKIIGINAAGNGHN